MTNRIRGLSIVFCIIILFAALIPATKSGQPQQLGNIDWKYSDLKAFDQPGEIDPGADLIAVYFRESEHRCEIRLDLLASSLEVIPEVYFLIDFLPGGQNYVRIASESINTTVEWDFAIRLLSNDFIQNIEPETSSSSFFYTTPLQINAKRNFEQDTIEIQFRCDAIGLGLPGAKIGIILVDPTETDRAAESTSHQQFLLIVHLQPLLTFSCFLQKPLPVKRPPRQLRIGMVPIPAPKAPDTGYPIY